MGIFSGIKSFLNMGNVGENVLDKDNGLIKQAGEWIGNQNFTTEEQAEMNVAIGKGVVSYSLATLNENTTRSKARREVALLIIKFYLLWASVGLGMWPINSGYAEFILLYLGGAVMGGAFGAVILFFFGSYGLTRYNETKK